MSWKTDLIVSVVELRALPVAMKSFSEKLFTKRKKKKDGYSLDEENLIQPLFTKQGQKL